MAPVIRISDETWQRLKSHARPLEDSADDVVRLALDALDKRHGSAKPGRGRIIANTANADSTLRQSRGTWPADVAEALECLDSGDGVHLKNIYVEVEKIRRRKGRSLPKNLESTVRQTLEHHSSDSDNFGGIDMFCMPKGKGAGIWGLRSKQQ